MMFNVDNIKSGNNPFDYWIIDNFLDIENAKQLSKEFIDYDSPAEDIVHYKDGLLKKRHVISGIDSHL